MAKPTKDDKTRRRAVKAARKVDKERAKQTRQEHDGKKDLEQSIGGSEKDGPRKSNLPSTLLLRPSQLPRLF
jgi:hypothetical protein